MYNLTAFTAADNVFELSANANSITDGWLFFGFILVFQAIILITLIRRGYRFIESLAASCLPSGIIVSILAYAGLMEVWAVILYGVLLIISVIGMFAFGE